LQIEILAAAKAAKVDSGTATPLRLGMGHALKSTCVKSEAVATAYLRAAHAYMLISMPTGTSTIFGAFQAICLSLQGGTDVALTVKLSRECKVRQ
jgi:hypothetical protein